MLQESEHFSRQKEKLSSWILDYDKNAYCDPKINEDSRELLIDSFNECSDLRKSFHNSLNQFFTNLGFSSMKNIHKYDNSFTYFEFDKHDKLHNNLGKDIGFSFIKNNSVSKYDSNKGGIINLKKKLRDNNKSKNKDKKKKKNVISLKKKIFERERENSKMNVSDEEYEQKVIESDNEDSDNINNIKMKKEKTEKKGIKEEKKDNDIDYLLNSIYNQFGISKKEILNQEEEKENKIFPKEEKNKYSEKKVDSKYHIKESNKQSNKDQKKGIISLSNKDEKEKMNKKINKLEINKLLEDEKDHKKELNKKIYEKPIINKERKNISSKEREEKVKSDINYYGNKDVNKDKADKEKIVYNKKINLEKSLEDNNINTAKTEKEEKTKKLNQNIILKTDINEILPKKIKQDNIKDKIEQDKKINIQKSLKLQKEDKNVDNKTNIRTNRFGNKESMINSDTEKEIKSDNKSKYNQYLNKKESNRIYTESNEITENKINIMSKIQPQEKIQKTDTKNKIEKITKKDLFQKNYEISSKKKIEQDQKISETNLDKEKIQKEKEDLEKKAKEKEKKERLEKERIEKERKEKELKERIEKEKREKLEKERLERIEKEREEKEKERLRIENEKKMKLERERKEKLEKERKERIEQERIKRLEQERIEREKLEKEEQEKKEKLEKERLLRIEQERIKKEKLLKEKIQEEKLLKQKTEKEKITKVDESKSKSQEKIPKIIPKTDNVIEINKFPNNRFNISKSYKNLEKTEEKEEKKEEPKRRWKFTVKNKENEEQQKEEKKLSIVTSPKINQQIEQKQINIRYNTEQKDNNEKEKIIKYNIEKEKKDKELAEKLEKERKERERIEKEKLEREQLEQKRKEKIEKEKLIIEKQNKLDKEKKDIFLISKSEKKTYENKNRNISTNENNKQIIKREYENKNKKIKEDDIKMKPFEKISEDKTEYIETDANKTEKKEEKRSLWKFHVKDKEEHGTYNKYKQLEKAQEKQIIEIGMTNNNILQEKEGIEKKRIISARFSPTPKQKEEIKKINNEINIKESKIDKDNQFAKNEDLKIKSSEKIVQNKSEDSQVEKNKITKSRFITSQSYKNIEEIDNKKEKKEEPKRTWRFGTQNKESSEINIIGNKSEEIKDKKIIEKKQF